LVFGSIASPKNNILVPSGIKNSLRTLYSALKELEKCKFKAFYWY